MSSLRQMTLREAIPLINKFFESFGVKSAILLKDNEWINAVTVMHFTRRKVEDLNSEFRLLEQRLGKIDTDSFKVIFQARPIDEINHVLTELEKGYLKIRDLRTNLLAKEPQKTFDQKISNAGYVMRLGEYAEYECYSAALFMDISPDRVLSESGISALTLGLRDIRDLARSWLRLDDLSSTINVHVVVPIYAKVGEIRYQGGSEIKATLKTDQRLFDRATMWVTRKGPGDRAPILERTRYDAVSCDNVPQNGFVYISLKHNFSGIGPRDRISVSLLHNELGLLDQEEVSMVQFTSQPPDPVSQTFALFDAGKKMEEHLLNPKTDKDFVASVSWLLERIDIRTLKLGRDETVRENQTEKGSADIIAYHSEPKEVLVIDCTIAVPSESKIDKIKSTAEYISRKITFPVKAVIVTAKKSPLAKQLASRYDVKILDNTDLEDLINLYKKGSGWYPRARVRVFENQEMISGV